MNIREQAITELLTQGIGYRKLAAKYGVSRTTICKWVQIHQGIHNIATAAKQQKYYLSCMNSKPALQFVKLDTRPKFVNVYKEEKIQSTCWIFLSSDVIEIKRISDQSNKIYFQKYGRLFRHIFSIIRYQ